MNKIFLIFWLILVSCSIGKAQVFIKFHIDTTFETQGNIKVLKDEILEITNQDSTTFHLLFGEDTLIVYKDSIKMDTFSKLVDYRSKKNNLVKLFLDEEIFFDVKYLNSFSETVKLVSENQELITLLINDSIQTRSRCGNSFRLIISNTPTIFYQADFLEKYTDPSGGKNVMSIWIYTAVAVLVFLFIGFMLYRRGVIFPEKEPIYEKFNHKNLDDFAKLHNIKIKKLIKWNKSIILSQYLEVKDNKKTEIQSKLKGQTLVIGYRKKSEQNGIQLDTGEETQKPLINISSPDSFSKQLQDVEFKILSEFQKISNKLNNSNDQLLNSKISSLETEKKLLEESKANLEKLNQQFGEEQKLMRNDLLIANEQSQKNKLEVSKYSERVMFLDFLKDYCKGVSTYFSLCNEVSILAYEYFNRINTKPSEQAFIIFNLLMNYQNIVNNLPIGKWQLIVQDIAETGVTNNQKIKNSLNQPISVEDKKKDFQLLLFSEVLVKYSSSILILAEAFRNLARFQVQSEVANDAQRDFSKYVTELVKMVKLTELEYKYVPLFNKFEDYLGQAESINSSRSYAYNNVLGLEKGSIVEIVSFGVKTFWEDTKTKIIEA